MAIWISFIMNAAIVIMTVFAFIAMFIGWNFMGKAGNLDDKGIKMFKFFTIDSNILMGCCSLVMTIAEIPVLCGKAEALPPAVYAVKLTGTSAVTLTFLVTVFFLVPQFKNPMELFYNSNLFFHLLVPLAAILSFVLFERKAPLPAAATLLGVLPAMLYAVFYVQHIFGHLADGKVDKKYDFYNFLGGKKERAPIAVVIVFAFSYLFSLLLWFANRIG